MGFGGCTGGVVFGTMGGRFCCCIAARLVLITRLGLDHACKVGLEGLLISVLGLVTVNRGLPTVLIAGTGRIAGFTSAVTDLISVVTGVLLLLWEIL